MDESVEPLPLPDQGNTIKILEKIASTEPVWRTCRDCRGDFGLLEESGRCRGCDVLYTEGLVAEQENRKLREAHKDHVINLLGGQKAYDEYTLTSFRVSPGTQEAFKAAQDFDPERENLFLFSSQESPSSTGIGKSHLAYAVARRFMAPVRIEAEVYKVEKLMRWFQMRDPREQEIKLARLASLRVLVLDDIGVEKASGFNLGILYDLIDTREMNGRKGLIVTCNIPMGSLAAAWGDDRVPSRLNGMCRRIEMSGQDMRAKENKKP